MSRVTPFSIGQRWDCDRGPGASYAKPNFWFVVLGPAQQARLNESRDAKLCLMEIDWRKWADSAEDFNRRYGSSSGSSRARLSTFSTKHLRKHATQENLTPEELAASTRECEKILARIQPALGLSIETHKRGETDKMTSLFRLAEALARENTEIPSELLKLVPEVEAFALSRELASVAAAAAASSESETLDARVEAGAPKRRMRL